MKKHSAFLFIGLCVLPVSSAWGLNTSAPEYKCLAGDCVNGAGSVYDSMRNQTIEGVWSNGQTIPGERYTVSHR
jgi:hypothetical protein